MRRIYFFIFLSVWMFAACSSNSEMKKMDVTDMDAPVETQAATPAEPSEDTSDDMASPDGPMASKADEEEVFHHPGVGFSLTKPSNWKYLSPEMALAARQSTKLDDKELEKAIKENPNAPLVVITRHHEPYPTLNPSVSVQIANLAIEGMPPKDYLSMNIEVLKRAFPDLTYVDKVQDTNVDGVSGAYSKVKYTYTLAEGGQKYPALARMWMLPRGNKILTISMHGPQEGPDVSEETFNKILSSIKIDKQ